MELTADIMTSMEHLRFDIIGSGRTNETKEQFDKGLEILKSCQLKHW